MATQVTLKAGLRDGRGKGAARKLRADGNLPAVVYGGDQDPLALTLSTHDTTLLFHSISTDNTIVNLEVEGQRVPVPTLVREIQTHPTRPDILHVDFLRIQMGVKVELDIPVHVTGTARGVKDDGGVLEQSIHHLPIRCLPTDIPEEILVEVSELGVGDSIHVADLVVPESVEVLLDGERMICSIQVPTVLVVEEEEEPEEEAEMPVRVGEEEEGEEEAGSPKDEGGRE